MLTTVEGNKLIARFLGYEYYPKIGNEQFPGWRKDKYFGKAAKAYLCRSHNDLHFNSSWDRLIPVVEKIESIRDEFHGYFGVSIYSNACSIQGTKLNIEEKHYAYFSEIYEKTKILAVWTAVVIFIQWYNQYKNEEIHKEDS